MPFTRAGKLTVHYAEAGRRDAPTVVFVNSLGTSLELWDDQVAALGSAFRIVRYDMRGHGLTATPPQRTFTMDELAADLAALLDALAIARASIVGLSIGGVVAQRFAAEFPQRVERLVLCATGNRIGTAAMWDARMELVERGGMEAIVDGVLARWFAPATHANQPALVDGFRQMIGRTPVAGYVGCCAALRDADLAADDARIVAPTLVVAGDADEVTPPATGTQLCAAIPGARLAVIPGAAHILNVDRPVEFNALLARFLGVRSSLEVTA